MVEYYTDLLPRRWRPLDRPDFGLMNHLSLSISKAEISEPDLLPDLRRSEAVFVFSDFGSTHKAATYEALSFLFIDPRSVGRWLAIWQPYRSRILKDKRRMAFKNLRDRRRLQALVPFLNAANELSGLLATILVPRNIGSIFRVDGQLQVTDMEEFEHWRPISFERLMRAVHIVGFFLAGLSAPNQDVFWYSDEDEIAPNDERLFDVCELFKRVASHYLAHMMRHFRFGTSRSEDGTMVLEDLLSIPDLAAGLLAELFGAFRSSGLGPKAGILVPPPENLSPKARLLLSWFANSRGSLRRLVYSLESEEGLNFLEWRRLHLFGSAPPA